MGMDRKVAASSVLTQRIAPSGRRPRSILLDGLDEAWRVESFEGEERAPLRLHRKALTYPPKCKGVAVPEARPHNHPESERVWGISRAACIQIDVQRDDGTRKYTGAFQHDSGPHGRVDVIAAAVAMPFLLDPIQSQERRPAP